MVLSKLLLICLELLAAGTVLGWNHVSKYQLLATIDSNDIVLVAFVVPWSEASKTLEPEWMSAAAQTKKPFKSIDCSIEADLCSKNEVISYPSIRLYRGNDSVTSYRGPREASAIASFINRATLPVVSTVDGRNITAFKSIDEIVFIAYMAPEHVQFESAFLSIATSNHHRFSFGISTSSSFVGADKIALPSIVCYKAQEGEQEVLSGESGVDAMEAFVETATTPLIGQMTRRNEMKYLNAGKSLVYVFATTENERSAYRTSLKPVAKKYREYLNFVTIDAVEYASTAPALGLQPNAFPALVVLNPIYGQFFPYDQRKVITADAVEGFILDIVQGRKQPNANGAGESHDEL